MSKLLDSFDQISQNSPQPIGFGRKAESIKKSPLLLIANVATDSDALLVSKSPIDAAILVDVTTKSQVAKLSKTLERTLWGVMPKVPKGENFKGSDFQVFNSELTPVSVLKVEDQSSILKIDPEMEDSTLRIIEDIPIDCFMLSLCENEDLRLTDLIQISRVRSVTGKWLLVHLKRFPGKTELEMLRDLGVNAIVIDLDNLDLKQIKSNYDLMLSLAENTSLKRNDKRNAKIPALGIPGGVAASSEPLTTPEELDDEDDEYY